LPASIAARPAPDRFAGCPTNRISTDGSSRRQVMTLGTVLLVILILMLLGALPAWPYSREWGYGPSGIAGLVVIVLIVLLLMGRI
jgi:hypothetical protein